MTNLIDFLQSRGASQQPDWRAEPWASARDALSWLGLASAPSEEARGTGLPDEELHALAGAMASELVAPDGVRPWSSHRIDSALRSASIASGGAPPEALLRAVWDNMAGHGLDAIVYEFSREFGRQLLGTYRHDSRWRFDWLGRPVSSGQACFIYWTIGVKPDRYSDELEGDVARLTSTSGFNF